MAKNIAIQLVESTLVVVHNHRPPSDEDWQVFMDAWKRYRDAVTAQLVVTDGGAPNAQQRRESVLWIAARRGGPPPTAVVSSSLMARGAVTALSWFIKDRIRAFSPQGMGEACAFLGVAHLEPKLRDIARELRRELSSDASN